MRRPVGHHPSLGLIYGTHACADLAIEIRETATAEIHNGKFSDTEASQRQEVYAAYTAQSGDGHPLPSQHLLFSGSHPADVA